MLKPLLNKIAEAVFVLDLYASKCIINCIYRGKMRAYVPGSDDPDVFGCLGGFDIVNIFIQPRHLYIIQGKPVTNKFTMRTYEIGFFFIDHRNNPKIFKFRYYVHLSLPPSTNTNCYLYMECSNPWSHVCSSDVVVYTPLQDTKSIKLFEKLTDTVISF